MSKVAWVFPGQGAQFVGMGHELIESDSDVRHMVALTDRALGYNLSKIMAEGPKEELTLTPNAQPALLVLSVACAHVLTRSGLHPDMLAGLSLGEYTALTVAGSLSLEDAVVLTHRRGVYMQEACPPGQGTMVAVLGLSCAEVDAICYEAKEFGEVAGANYNCPGQVVVSGATEAIVEVTRRATVLGARTMPLAVSAPFHCALMEPAAKRLSVDLERVSIKRPSVPVYSNVTGEPVDHPDDIRKALLDQVTSPVLWQMDMESMVRDGADGFIEVGPGKSLTGFGKRINAGVRFVQFAKMEDLPAVLAFAKEEIMR